MWTFENFVLDRDINSRIDLCLWYKKVFLSSELWAWLKIIYTTQVYFSTMDKKGLMIHKAFDSISSAESTWFNNGDPC